MEMIVLIPTLVVGGLYALCSIIEGILYLLGD